MSINKDYEMFGCLRSTLDEAIERAGFRMGYPMMVISMLSDAQEELARGESERCRHIINRVKYIIDHKWQE